MHDLKELRVHDGESGAGAQMRGSHTSTARRSHEYVNLDTVRQRKPRRRRFQARAFWLTLLCVAVLASGAYLRDVSGKEGEVLGGRYTKRSAELRLRELELNPVRKKHDEDEGASHDCHLVNDPTITDKCAFVRQHCPDEEAGLISYLELYYCGMPHAKPVTFTLIVLWLGLLFSTIGIAASDFFCVNLSTISSLLGMSESLAGVTFLAFGNGSPDVFSTFAAMSTNSGSLAVGELIGAACFITAVVAGSMALARPFKVAKRSFVRDVGFFIVAASFALIFLRDGELHLWECIAMVGFYIFYVIFVVTWHWWLTRRRKLRLKEAAIRSEFVMPGGEEAEVEPYVGDDDDETGGRPTSIHAPSMDDISNLERGGVETVELEDVDEAGAKYRDEWLGVNRNMRLSRPRAGERRNTQTPIRPSLVGALEFRAIRHSLRKSQNFQSIPISDRPDRLDRLDRRYSDDPVYTTAQQQHNMNTQADPGSRPPYQIEDNGSHLTVVPRRAVSQNRNRAVSMNDVDGVNRDIDMLRQETIPRIDLLSSTPETRSSNTLTVPIAGLEPGPPSPSISITPPGSVNNSRAPSPAPSRRRTSSTDLLALPPNSTLVRESTLPAHAQSPQSRSFPKLNIPTPSARRSSPTTSPFPTFEDHSPRPPSLRLPPPSISGSSFPQLADMIGEIPDPPSKPLRWWPYHILPPPSVLIATLFPTLSMWRDKNIWEKILGIISAPSVFLLTITLPVVENGAGEDERHDTDVPTLTLVTPASEPPNNPSKRDSRGSVSFLLDPNGQTERYRDDPSDPGNDGSYFGETRANQGYGTLTENNQAILHHAQPVVTSPTHPHILQSPEQLPFGSPSETTWNRWLVIVQTFTAPFFCVLVFWANASELPSTLLKPALISVLCSLILLLFILWTTTPTRPPRWRNALCFVGFVVAIAWISTIANEVVGVLKWLGVVLNISDAILGLTIFAVGNSLGDLVADITVARLGFPVMALSACFGGPMLNILLGIGVSGSYISITKARKKAAKHPGQDMRFKPYRLDVSPTLLVSGATLLITLVALLVVVPIRKWRMDRVIGIGLVSLWVVSTIANVGMEVAGVWGRHEH